MSIVETIKSRGYWRIEIHPRDFVERRIEISRLAHIIRSTAVELTGWDFPHIGSDALRIHLDYVSQETNWEHFVETWRFYQSGLFIFLGCIPNDWRDRSGLWSPHPKWKANSEMPVSEAVSRYTEVFELATRLALSEMNADSLKIRIGLHNLSGRHLVLDYPNRVGFSYARTTSLETFPYEREVSKAELAAEGWDLALDATSELFARFDWTPGKEMLRTMQASLRSGRGA